MRHTYNSKLTGAISGHFLIDLYTPILPIILPLLIVNMGLSYFLAGLVITVFNVTSSITQPFIGLYGDKTGKRASIPLCVLIGSVGISLSVLANDYLILLLLVGGAAIGHALFHPSAMALVHKLSPPAKKGLYNSIFTTSGSISYALGPLIAGLLITFGGLTSVVWMIVPGIVGAAWLYRNDRRTGKIEPVKQVRVEKDKTHGKYWWVPAGLVVTVCALRAWAYVGVITYLPTLLLLWYQGIDTITVSLIITLMLGTSVFGQVAGGYLSDRYGRKRVLVLGFTAAIPFFCMIFLTTGIMMYVGIMMYAFFASFCYVTSVTMTQDLLPGSVGFASGLTLGFSMGFGGVGAALIGMAADVMGSLPDAMFLLIVPTVLCPILALFIKYSERKVEKIAQ
ncbi:MAG TPA: MFS transporter [Methanocorpusculum sp.]|nr:MFS transporter [Methanocorpusculum sp.]HJJ53100.1 MFS transporter [Methanocorpusculum sp.]